GCRGCSSRVSVCFFFSSRRRHTRLVSDWSSDVCSSDLGRLVQQQHLRAAQELRGQGQQYRLAAGQFADPPVQRNLLQAKGVQCRSEERRVGKEGRSRWAADHCKEKVEGRKRQ